MLFVHHLMVECALQTLLQNKSFTQRLIDERVIGIEDVQCLRLRKVVRSTRSSPRSYRS